MVYSISVDFQLWKNFNFIPFSLLQSDRYSVTAVSFTEAAVSFGKREREFKNYAFRFKPVVSGEY